MRVRNELDKLHKFVNKEIEGNYLIFHDGELVWNNFRASGSFPGGEWGEQLGAVIAQYLQQQVSLPICYGFVIE